MTSESADQSARRIYPYAMTSLLVALFGLFVTMPFVQELPVGQYVDAALFSVVLAAALVCVAGRTGLLTLALVLVVPAAIGTWLTRFSDRDEVHVLALVASLLFVGVVMLHLLVYIVRSRVVDAEVLSGGLALYLLLAIFWANLYVLLARLNPDAFRGVPPHRQPLHGFDALYFSVGALTTGGFGDITPVSAVARMLGILEAIVGTLFLAVMVSRLVSLYAVPTNPSDLSD